MKSKHKMVNLVVGLLFKKTEHAMSVLEEIQAKTSQLPPELQAEVLDFIQFLDFKKSRKHDSEQERYPRLLNKRGGADDSCPRLPNKFGAGKGLITYIADDFDAPLGDLKEYMY